MTVTTTFKSGHIQIYIMSFIAHRSTTYADAACCYRPSSVHGLSACITVVSPVKMDEPIENQDAVWVEDSGGPKEPYVRWRSTSPVLRGNFEGKE